MQIKFGMQIKVDLFYNMDNNQKFESSISKDSLKLEFRSNAQTKKIFTY
jgi:hypothetical protein